MANLKSFQKQLKASQKKTIGQVLEVQKSVATKAFQFIAQDATSTGFQYGSPVWSGRYRASHNISINNVNTSVSPPNEAARDAIWPEPPASVLNAPPISEASRVLAGLKPFETIIISNSLPYAKDIEQGASKFKAPQGVYRVTALAVASEFKNVRLT